MGGFSERLRDGIRADLEALFLQQREWLEQRLGEAPTAKPRAPPAKLPSAVSFRPQAEAKHSKQSKRPSYLRSYTEVQQSRMREAAKKSRQFAFHSSTRIREHKENWLKYLVHTARFESFCGLLILSNAIMIGVEADYRASRPHEDAPGWFEVVALVYTILFAAELVLRVVADIKSFLCSDQWLWNLSDTTIVLISLAELALDQADVDGPKNLTFVRIIRMARMLRVFRIIRLVKVFTPLRVLVHSVLTTLKSLIWTLVLLVIILYLFGVLFTQAVSESARELGQKRDLDLYYGSLLKSVSTLFKSITGGVSWQEVSDPLDHVHPWWEFAFFMFIAFIYFAVFNVVTGIFCQSAIESANYDKDMVVQAQLSMKQVYTKQLQDLFHSMDSRNTGQVTLVTLESCLQNDKVQAYFRGLDITADDAWNLFKLLKDDTSSAIDVEQFVTGCLRLRGSARSVDIHMLMHESRWMRRRLTDLIASFNALTGVLPPRDSEGESSCVGAESRGGGDSFARSAEP